MADYFEFLIWGGDHWVLVAMFRDQQGCEAMAGLARMAWNVAVACVAHTGV